MHKFLLRLALLPAAAFLALASSAVAQTQSTADPERPVTPPDSYRVVMENERVRIIIREEYQHPTMFGKVSFPSQGGGDIIRAYTKESLLRYDREDDEDMSNEDEYYDGGDEPEEMTLMP